MKIEKLNDNQIRCTLTRADLDDRHIKLSELICGSEKAKSLFHEMMEMAADEFGFEAENIPLMIEAVPTSSDCIILIITKVENPDELDSKFSKYGTSLNDFENNKHNTFEKLEGADDILDLIEKVKKAVSEPPKQLPENEEHKKNDNASKIRLFSFATIDSVIHACHLLKSLCHGSSTLYKDVTEQIYILALAQSDQTPAEFNKTCNMLSEFGSAEKASTATLAFLEEHCEVLVSTDAIEQLGNI